MLTNFILLFLFSGVPYYLYLEKHKTLSYGNIFLLSAFLLACGTLLLYFTQEEISIVVMVLLFMVSLFSLYKAYHTTNFYKLSYYLLFSNSPMLMFHSNEANYYGASLLVTLFGVYLMGQYYERKYGSANYQSVTGITLVTPYAGFFLTVYLSALALYPPFPNSLMFLDAILSGEINFLWYVIVLVVFLGNFLIAMRVMAKTVFGKPNEHVHYIDLSKNERWVHYLMLLLLTLLSILGFQELLR